MITALVGLWITLLHPALSFAGQDRNLINQCGESSEPLPWKYCVTRTRGSHNPDVLYLLHGGGGDETDWISSPENAKIRELWKRARFAAPTVVTVSFGAGWLLVDRNTSPKSGLFEVFTQAVMPMVEKKLLGHRIRHRQLFGYSMGGFNAATLLLRMPWAFERAVLGCPGLATISPYASESEVADYTRRNHADPQSILSALSVAREFIPNNGSWIHTSPLHLADRLLGPRTPRFLISCGESDEYGFHEGAMEFALTARRRGSPVIWQSLKGGHCVMDLFAIAGFLQASHE